MSSPIDDIHNINSGFNRIFSFPIFILSFVSLLILLVSTYRMRIAYAWFINIFFNRPRVYLVYFSKTVMKPMRWLTFSLIYLVFGAPFFAIVKLSTLLVPNLKVSKAGDTIDTENMY